MNPRDIALVATGYLSGSIPFGVVITKGIYGIDIREHGSGNPGATNVWRVIGAKAGAPTLALDIAKGIFPVVLGRHFAPDNPLIAVLAGLAAIVGHNWSLFLRGRGGKGVATSAGVFLALMPGPAAIALITFLIFFFITRHVSIGSMAAAVALATASFVFPTSPWLRGLVLVASLMVLVKHVPNMKRLARGEEPKVKFK